MFSHPTTTLSTSSAGAASPAAAYLGEVSAHPHVRRLQRDLDAALSYVHRLAARLGVNAPDRWEDAVVALEAVDRLLCTVGNLRLQVSDLDDAYHEAKAGEWSAGDRIQRAEAEVARLNLVLGRYAAHDRSCRYMPENRCTCGLHKAWPGSRG